MWGDWLLVLFAPGFVYPETGEMPEMGVPLVMVRSSSSVWKLLGAIGDLVVGCVIVVLVACIACFGVGADCANRRIPPPIMVKNTTPPMSRNFSRRKECFCMVPSEDGCPIAPWVADVFVGVMVGIGVELWNGRTNGASCALKESLVGRCSSRSSSSWV